MFKHPRARCMPEIVKAACEPWGFFVVRLAFQGGARALLRRFPSLFLVAHGVPTSRLTVLGDAPSPSRAPDQAGRAGMKR